MKEYVVDLSAATSWADFIAAFNKCFVGPVGGGEWNGNLDAFNDYLWWPEEHPYRFSCGAGAEPAGPVVASQRCAHLQAKSGRVIVFMRATRGPYQDR